jgi:hypothetical protein
MRGIAMSITTISGSSSIALLHRSLAVLRNADDLEVDLGRDDLPQSLGDHRVIVCNQDPHAHGHPGTTTRTRVPRPGALSMSSWPCTARLRSRIVAIPRPVAPRGPLHSKPAPSSATSTCSASGCQTIRDPDRARAGMPRYVGERLLDDPQHRELVLAIDSPLDAVDTDVRRDLGSAAEILGRPAQRGPESQVVEHRRMQVVENPRDAACRRHDERMRFLQAVPGIGIQSAQPARKHVEVDAQRSEVLAHAIVQLGGQAAALGFLCVDEAPRECLQLIGSVGECVFALALVGDVEARSDHLRDPSCIVLERLAGDQQNPLRAFDRHHARLQLVARRLLERFEHCLANTLAVVRVHEVQAPFGTLYGHIPPDAEHAAQLARAGDAARGVVLPIAEPGQLLRAGKQPAVLAQRLLHAQALRDVDRDHHSADLPP